MSAAENLKKLYQEALAAKIAEREAEIEREDAAERARFAERGADLCADLVDFIPEGVTVEWKYDQTEARDWLAGYLAVDGESRRYLVDFIARRNPLEMRAKIGDTWRVVSLLRLAEYVGAAIEYQDTLAQGVVERDAAHAAEQAERNAHIEAARAGHAAARAAAERAAAEHDAEKAARRAEKLARRIGEVEATAAAQAKHLVNPSGLTYDEISHMATQALDTATDAGDRLPAVEQLRTEIGIFERQLKEAQAAAVWGTGGGNDFERKNNAAKALAADPEVKRLQAALDQMNRRLAEIESEYKAQAMKSGAWRAVAELYAGWLQSLR